MDDDVDMPDAPCGPKSNNNDTVCHEEDVGYISDESSFYGTSSPLLYFFLSKSSPSYCMYSGTSLVFTHVVLNSFGLIEFIECTTSVYLVALST